MRSIVLPEAKPALEWVNGRVLQKVSPRRKHSLAQMRFAAALDAWARKNACGRVGTEWEFRLQPPGEPRRPLVPDVAYLSFARVPRSDGRGADIPTVAPDAIVEVLSRGERRSDREDKLRVYFACGTVVAFLVDTEGEFVAARDKDGIKVFRRRSTLTYKTLCGFTLPVRMLFEEI
jgi:Uma2 family endonuclease